MIAINYVSSEGYVKCQESICFGCSLFVATNYKDVVRMRSKYESYEFNRGQNE